MYGYVTTDHPIDQTVFNEWGIGVITDFENSDISGDFLDTYNVEQADLTFQYLRATEVLQEIIEEHRVILNRQPEIFKRVRMLQTLFQRAIDDNSQTLSEVDSVGDRIFLDVLDMLDNIGSIASSSDEANEYAELEIQLTELYRQVF